MLKKYILSSVADTKLLISDLDRTWRITTDPYRDPTWRAVFRIRIRPDPKLFGLKYPEPDPKLLISDPDPALDPDPLLFQTKVRNMFLKCIKK